MKQTQALEILKSGQNVFLTGAAGSGKTFVLNELIKFLKNKKISHGVTAATGIAATHLGGITIHSWSGLGIRDQIDNWEMGRILEKSYLRKRIIGSEVLIIDEISMLPAHALDLVNKLCQAFRQNQEPFGGLQTIFAGDFFQLPPISREDRPAEFAIASKIWSNMNLKICYLEEQYRQEDKNFLNILNEIRANNLSENNQRLLFSRLQAKFDGALEPTKLYTHNIDVDAVNARELEKIKGEEAIYPMKSRGRRPLVEALKNGCLAPERLALKIGAKVMFVKNNFELGVVNGTLGMVVDFNDFGYPVVKIKNGQRVTAEPASWTIDEDNKIKAEIEQIPLRLAWAITIHKSQGLSLDLAEIDLSKSFVPGMGYVALSRVRNLDGLVLKGINETALRTNDEILILDSEFKNASAKTAEEWQNLTAEEKNKFQKFSDYNNKENLNVSGKEITRGLLAAKMSLAEIASQEGRKTSTIISHLEKLSTTGEKINILYLLPEEHELAEIKTAFEECGSELLKPVFDFLKERYSYEILRLVRIYLKSPK